MRSHLVIKLILKCLSCPPYNTEYSVYVKQTMYNDGRLEEIIYPIDLHLSFHQHCANLLKRNTVCAVKT